MASSILFETSTVCDLFFLLRSEVTRERRTLPPTWDPALEPIRSAYEAEPRLHVEGLIAESTSIEDFVAFAASASDARFATSLGLIAHGLREAAALYEPLAAGRAQRIGAARSYLEETIRPVERQCLEHMLGSLELDDPAYEIPVHLVCDVPRPGAYTVGSRRRPGICFVDVTRWDGPTLIEMVLHEVLHALDAASKSSTSAVARLRTAVASASVPPDDPRMRLAHALFFVQAADTVRRFVAPDHVDYGITHTYHARIGHVGDAARRLWSARLRSEITAGDAVHDLVKEIVGGRS